MNRFSRWESESHFPYLISRFPFFIADARLFDARPASFSYPRWPRSGLLKLARLFKAGSENPNTTPSHQRRLTIFNRRYATHCNCPP